MKKTFVMIGIIVLSLVFMQCKCNEGGNKMTAEKTVTAAAAIVATGPVVAKVTDALIKKHGQDAAENIKRGVKHLAGLWQEQDGTAEDFEAFCLKQYIASEKEREIVFNKFSRSFESIYGHFNKITLDLKEPMDLDQGELHPIDQMLGGYSVYSHLTEDFYKNKIAFIAALNFPYYSLEEKQQAGANWDRKKWAYARLGDSYIARVPAQLNQKYSEVNTGAEVYISQYNIFMGSLLNDKNEKPFPKDMVLLTHWNLRDEIKANYAVPEGLQKQDMVYEVMKRIIYQDIPQDVINSGKFDWNPKQNKLFKDGKPVEFKPEPDTRYQQILDAFNAVKAVDGYYPPSLDTFIKRAFSGDMEIPQEEVEALFVKFVSSPQVKKVAQLIKKRLNRDLQPYDIWYDGFKARSGISEEKLNAITKKLYPTAKALEKDLPNILVKLGFPKDKAEFLASRIVVDDARGSGHAWGPQMKAEVAHLRTRMPDDGMNYKGYNIAIHEFGHNVEQTISLHDVDYYMLNGVPNSAFTEALAFIFQERDLELLGMQESNPDKKYLDALDTFWSVYEIMGVSIVDMRVWKWMYQNPNADAAQLKEAVIKIAKDVWNNYFADAFGGLKDQPILAIYSHMVSYPLYLSGYAYGELIKFQIHRHIEGKDFAKETLRMFSTGTLVPQLWMKKAVGKEISIEPILKSAEEALENL